MSASTHDKPYYFVPNPSKYPILSSMALLCLGIGMAAWVNDFVAGPYMVLTGLLGFLTVLYYWFGAAAQESELGHYEKNVDHSFRWSMGWFIFSEIMFFAGFFGALFYSKHISMPWLADPYLSGMLWPDAKTIWPNFGPGGEQSLAVEPFKTVGPWGIPTINTILLLLSGVTLTISHHALRDDNRIKAKLWLALTIVLSLIFIGCQGYEYHHAYHELNLKMASGVYGSTFFMLTGFHGFHVILGTIMLICVLFRLHKGHFTANKHFGFEGAAWYWHFVDVVWLFLYIVIYWA